ncbi:NACHT domain-containing protein [Streptomyces wuyuanensis]|uniref:NACHT domain-containing protein n=1 Tax=Streptomyces wuyuanensis TaxID=1196353 RepID=UPI003D738F1C
MGVRRTLAFADALVLLGAEPPRLAALDRALGGALNIATGGVSGTVIGMADANGRLLGLGRDAVQGLGTRLVGARTRAERTELLRAAHTVIVVVAFFEAMQDADLPFRLEQLELTRREQLLLAREDSGSSTSGPPETDLVALLIAADLPCPAPHAPSEAVAEALLHRYRDYGARFADFVEGLAVWERLEPLSRQQARQVFTDVLPQAAQARYRSLFTLLAKEAPEFAFWAVEMGHQATRTEVRRALEGVETLLAGTVRAMLPPADVAAALARAHRSALTRTVLDADSVPEGIHIPALEELYVDPDFRVAGISGPGGPADEGWWERLPVRHDLTRFLAGALTSPHLTEAPLLVLGQPGAGKSVLTRVLAARLPSVGFLPVRVPLRDVRAEDELQDQIEQAVRATTGEDASWPGLVRASGGSMPVLLLDGFDELLQTTGVHQNNFLIRVAQFQRREADHGRPVVAIVTSRTAVADRVRYPDGMVALRLEPFRTEQIRQWLTVWNSANASRSAALGRAPLTWQHLERHAQLAAQPLLLTMLALYDATEGGLQRATGDSFDAADLYEELLTSFARREVAKSTRRAEPDDVTDRSVEQELQRLSLVAFAQLNRGRQWVSATELEEDFTAVLGPRQVRASGFRTPLTAAETALGRFFFVQRAQSVRDGRVLATYEFLHASFGEYLVVRLALHLLSELLTLRPALTLGEARIDDDLAYALLSHASLSSRQMPRFARSMTNRMTPDERERLARILVRVLAQHEMRTGDQHPAYRPAQLRTTTRHGLYGSNLVLMIILLVGRCSVAELFPDSRDTVNAWHRHCLLWRSAMDESQWTDFALTLDVHHYWDGDGRALDIALRSDSGGPPEPLDMTWLYRYRAGHDVPAWSRSYWDDMWHKMSISGGTNDSVVRHAMDPVFHWLGPAVATFTTVPGTPATSLAHDLLELLLADRDEVADSRLGDLYERALRGIRLLLHGRSPHLLHAVNVLVTTYAQDRERLSGELRDSMRELVREELNVIDDEHDGPSPLQPLLRNRINRMLW